VNIKMSHNEHIGSMVTVLCGINIYIFLQPLAYVENALEVAIAPIYHSISCHFWTCAREDE